MQATISLFLLWEEGCCVWLNKFASVLLGFLAGLRCHGLLRLFTIGTGQGWLQVQKLCVGIQSKQVGQHWNLVALESHMGQLHGHLILICGGFTPPERHKGGILLGIIKILWCMERIDDPFVATLFNVVSILVDGLCLGEGPQWDQLQTFGLLDGLVESPCGWSAKVTWLAACWPNNSCKAMEALILAKSSVTLATCWGCSLAAMMAGQVTGISILVTFHLENSFSGTCKVTMGSPTG